MLKFLSSLLGLVPLVVMAGDSQSFDKLLAKLDEVIEEKNPRLYATFQPGLTLKALEAMEAKNKIELPDAVKTLYRWHNGQDPNQFEAFANNRRLLSLEEVFSVKSMMDEMVGYDFEFENWWHEAWIPLFDNGGGDNLVVDLAGVHSGRENQLIVFYHDWQYRPVKAWSLQDYFIAVLTYYQSTAISQMDEFHDIEGFLVPTGVSFDAGGKAKPLK